MLTSIALPNPMIQERLACKSFFSASFLGHVICDNDHRRIIKLLTGGADTRVGRTPEGRKSHSDIRYHLFCIKNTPIHFSEI